MISKPIYIDLKYSFVVLTTLVSIKLWSFTGVGDKVFAFLEVVVLIGLVLIVLTNKIPNKELIFRNNAILFIGIPVLSALGALIFHDQALYLSGLVLRTKFFWLLYFVLHIFNIPTKKIINLLILVGLVWIFLTVVQQFTYPRYYFANKNEDTTYYFLRAGVYRFMLNRHHYGLFIVLYFFYNFLLTKRLNNLYFVAIGLVGFYYYGTRQFAIAAIACMAYTVFLIRGSARVLAFSSLAAFAILIFIYQDELFGQYVEMTSNQIQSDDDIRLIAAHFFFFDYWPHWFAMVIGNGPSHFSSAYGKEIEYFMEYLHLYRSDVGIIGAYNQFGILYVLNVAWLILKGLRNRYYTSKTKYLKLIFINSLLLILISEYFVNPSAIPFFCFILYLVDKSYEDKQKEVDNRKKEEQEKSDEEVEVMAC